MEPNILDLRQQRCPMALLLAKRHIAQLSTGESTTILICDLGSQRDIEAYLVKQNLLWQSYECGDYNSLKVVKETSFNVRNG